MNKKLLEERQLILALAFQEAHRKKGECQARINDLDSELSSTSKTPNDERKEQILESKSYLTKCRDGWQETLHLTIGWIDELRAEQRTGQSSSEGEKR